MCMWGEGEGRNGVSANLPTFPQFFEGRGYTPIQMTKMPGEKKDFPLIFLFLRPIKRITSRDPDDPMSPFYKSSGGPLRPLATLTIQKLREYKKACSSLEEPEPLVFHEVNMI